MTTLAVYDSTCRNLNGKLILLNDFLRLAIYNGCGDLNLTLDHRKLSMKGAECSWPYIASAENRFRS